MRLEELNKVKNFTYAEYVEYLQEKYGLSKTAYFTEGWSPIAKTKRTSEGLFVHHVKEDCEIMLGNKKFAEKQPYEYQLPKNLVYCDYLEHLLLHILIVKYPGESQNLLTMPGIGGIINFLIPELNDYYSGYPIKQAWKQTVFDKVKDDLDAYIEILKIFVEVYNSNFLISAALGDIEQYLCTSASADYGVWSHKNNTKLYTKIMDAVKDLL